MSQPQTSSAPHPTAQDEISLVDLAKGLWRQRIPIVLSIVLFAVLGGAILGVILAASPREQVVSLPFRLQFPGALESRYPNGTQFQPSDLVAPSVVRPIFDRFQLSRYGTYDEFKTALTVVEANFELDKLRLEYEARLANTRLSQAERSEVEAQYDARRRAARTAEFRLQLLPGTGIPTDLAPNILNAVLEGWATEAQNTRGAWLYDVAIPGLSLLDEAALADEDYLVIVDIFRVTLERIQRASRDLAAIPGSNLVRVPGPNGLSLVELQARLSDVIRFKVDPLYAQIHSLGLFRDESSTIIYLQHRLFLLGLDAVALEEKGRAIHEVLAQMRMQASMPETAQARAGGGSAVVIPQFGEGFFDRLLEMGAQTADVEFRRRLSEEIIAMRHEMIDINREQQLYKTFLSMFEENRSNQQPAFYDENRRDDAIERVEARFDSIASDIRFLLQQLQGLHLVISEQNLQPHRIYQVTGPLELRKTNPLDTRTFAGVGAGSLFLGGFFALLIAWFRESGIGG